MGTYVYFDIAHAIGTHDFIIENSGGHAGAMDTGKIESVLQHIQNNLYYPKFEDKLTHLVFSVNKFHAFNDGNNKDLHCIRGISVGSKRDRALVPISL
ncbi:MAG: Fic family protein, partial [Marinirhabdus sp.]